MPTITFKAKPKNGCIKVPQITHKHCDMQEFRESEKYGPYANSNLFEYLIRRQVKETLSNQDIIRLDSLPTNVSVNTGQFLAIVTITL